MQDLEKLKEILAALRHPETGCPWDRVQTFASIAPQTVEEAYEVLTAAEAGDYDNLKEEVGDLLLHIMFYSDMAREKGKFDFDEVVDALCAKLIARHPHVFGGAERAKDAGEALTSWEKVKAAERKESAAGGALDGIANGLPSLTRAFKMHKRLAREGLAVPKIFALLADAVADLGTAAGAPEAEGALEAEAEKRQALGRVLFLLAGAAAEMKVDPMLALRDFNHEFEGRFKECEAGAEGVAAISASTVEKIIMAK